MAAKVNEARTADVTEAWQKRNLSEVHRVARSMAYSGVCTKKRVYHLLPTSRPDVEEWKEFVAKPGCDGGLRAEVVQGPPCVLHALEGTSPD